jgi:hypothetical protein
VTCGDVLFQMRNHRLFILGLEIGTFRQDTSTTVYSSMYIVKYVHVAAFAKTANRHRPTPSQNRRHMLADCKAHLNAVPSRFAIPLLTSKINAVSLQFKSDPLTKDSNFAKMFCTDDIRFISANSEPSV